MTVLVVEWDLRVRLREGALLRGNYSRERPTSSTFVRYVGFDEIFGTFV